jgi:nucleoside-diphosphate-sugar epimerase
MPALAPLFTGRAARLVYLSTTGVYGDAFEVNESTPVAPRHRREVLRTEEEQAVLAGPWKGIVLRPAAIYGPGRGIHESMKEGTYRLMGDGSNFISRIHVDDLAALAEAALYSDLEGAYAAADAEPCPAREIAEFCSRLLDLPMPPGVGSLPADDTRRSNRRVDGGRILALLGISLRYPSYRTGIPASLTQTT